MFGCQRLLWLVKHFLFVLVSVLFLCFWLRSNIFPFACYSLCILLSGLSSYIFCLWLDGRLPWWLANAHFVLWKRYLCILHINDLALIYYFSSVLMFTLQIGFQLLCWWKSPAFNYGFWVCTGNPHFKVLKSSLSYFLYSRFPFYFLETIINSLITLDIFSILRLDPPHLPSHSALYPLILYVFLPIKYKFVLSWSAAAYLGLDRKRNPTLCLKQLSVVNTSSATSETSWPPPLSMLGLSLAWASTGNIVWASISAKSLLCWRFLCIRSNRISFQEPHHASQQ